MGSYLSIHNDTDEVWMVKVGPARIALHITKNVFGGLAVVAAAGAGAVGLLAAPLVLPLGLAAGAGLIGAGFNGANRFVEAAIYNLEREGMIPINPNETHRWGKMSLSLWQEATCVCIRPNPANPNEVLETTLVMDVNSGATVDSNPVYRINEGLARPGKVRTRTVQVPAGPAAGLPLEPAGAVAEAAPPAMQHERRPPVAGVAVAVAVLVAAVVAAVRVHRHGRAGGRKRQQQ